MTGEVTQKIHDASESMGIRAVSFAIKIHDLVAGIAPPFKVLVLEASVIDIAASAGGLLNATIAAGPCLMEAEVVRVGNVAKLLRLAADALDEACDMGGLKDGRH